MADDPGLPKGYRVAVDGAESGPFLNRLTRSSSPYLKQHAHNPVDWWPWGDAAFAQALALDRPVLLSVGYAACHWCHVMERESFMDVRVASRLNTDFICIKVDREEHPEVDAFAMQALLELCGDAGWPANLLLTPQRAPFDGGTYFPPSYRYGMAPFSELLRRVSDAWAGRSRASLLDRADQTLGQLRRRAGPVPGQGLPPADWTDRAISTLVDQADAHSGGWGGGARFPQAPRLLLLLEEGQGAGVDTVLECTLTAMERGGLHDHLGGGFHRYTVDSDWELPHFEKMLCDNALLIDVFLQGWARFGSGTALQAANNAVEFCLRELRLPDGSFAASLDADDARGEGAFYTWTPEEFSQALGPRAGLIGAAFGLTGGGAAEGGRHVLRRVGDPSLLAMARPALWKARSNRPAPARDDKAVLAWNGLLLSALCRAAAKVGDPRYRAAAIALGARLGWAVEQAPLGRTLSPDTPPASLEDRAAVGLGLLALHGLSGDPRSLLQASRLGVEILTLHQDAETGSLLSAPLSMPQLPVQATPVEDGAEPSAVGLALLLLNGLSALADSAIDEPALAAATQAAVARMEDAPWRGPSIARALARGRRPPRCLVITGPADDGARAALVAVAARLGAPDLALLIFDPEGPEAAELAAAFGVLMGKTHAGPAQAWLCEGASCRLPIRDAQALADALRAQPKALAPSGIRST